MLGAVIMILAALALIARRLTGVGSVVVSRGRHFRISFDRPDRILDTSYAVVTIPLQPCLLVTFAVCLVLLVTMPIRP